MARHLHAPGLLLLVMLPSCGGGGPTDPGPSATTTTTTTTTATTTTTTSTSTTSTTTTTTMPAAVTYASVHPIWASRGCTACHTAPNRLVLTGNASSVCTTIRSGRDRQGGEYLDNPACSLAGSSIVRVSSTGLLPAGGPHAGASDGCFGAGGSCRETLFAWCSGGATCP